jgi:hypothetical protein
MQVHRSVEDEILSRYRRGAQCREISFLLCLPLDAVVACVLKGVEHDPGLLRRLSHESEVPLPPAPGRLPSRSRPGNDPEDFHDEVDPRSDEDLADEDEVGETDRVTGRHARGWLVTAEQYAVIFSDDRGRFADIRLKQARYGTPSLFQVGSSRDR